MHQQLRHSETAFLHRVYADQQNKKQLIPSNGDDALMVEAGVAAVHWGGGVQVMANWAAK